MQAIPFGVDVHVLLHVVESEIEQAVGVPVADHRLGHLAAFAHPLQGRRERVLWLRIDRVRSPSCFTA
jgi:hypothetical protein